MAGQDKQKVPKYLIYGLIDPRNGELRYVGKSSNGIYRPRCHTGPSALKNERSYKARWVKGLVQRGLKPEIEILEGFESKEHLNEAEQFWIAYFRFVGCRLTNLTAGGDGCLGHKPTAEHRRKIGEANKRRVHTPEMRARQSAAMRGKPSWCKGKKMSFEWRLHNSLSHNGLSEWQCRDIVTLYECGFNSPDVAGLFGVSTTCVTNLVRLFGGKVRRQADSIRGKKASPETRAKQSRARAGRPLSEYHRKRIGEGRKGCKNKKPFTEDQRIKKSREQGGRPFVDQNGVRYETVRGAAKALGIDKASIQRILHGKQKQTYNGYRFTYCVDSSEALNG